MALTSDALAIAFAVPQTARATRMVAMDITMQLGAKALALPVTIRDATASALAVQLMERATRMVAKE